MGKLVPERFAGDKNSVTPMGVVEVEDLTTEAQRARNKAHEAALKQAFSDEGKPD